MYWKKAEVFFCFNKQGKFIKMIGRQGKGPVNTLIRMI